MKCTAHRRRDGKPCGNDAMKGKKVCRLHGGLSLAGINSPRFKHGKYSKHLPTQLLTNYNRAKVDPELLSMIDEIALVDARIQETMKSLTSGGSQRAWKDLRKFKKEFDDARKKGDIKLMMESMSGLSAIIERGEKDGHVWDDLFKTIFARQRLVESERRRMVELGQMISSRELMGIFTQVIDILREYIKDKNLFNSVLHALTQRVIDRPDEQETRLIEG